VSEHPETQAVSEVRHSILIALDPSAPGYASLELLGQLLERRDRRLLGLAIEDTDLLAHARSRLATEIVLSGIARPLKLRNLERQLRAQSTAIRAAFEERASQLGLPHAFKILRGTAAAELTLAAAGADLLIVELPRVATGVQSVWSARLEQLSAAELPTVLFAREGWSAGNTVVAVIDTPEEIQATTRAAGDLARAGHAALTVLIGEAARTEEPRIRAVLEAAASGRPVRLRHLTPTELASETLAYLARIGNARALVAPARLARSNARFVRDLLRLTSCSIMLVNPAGET